MFWKTRLFSIILLFTGNRHYLSSINMAYRDVAFGHSSPYYKQSYKLKIKAAWSDILAITESNNFPYKLIILES